MSHFMRVGVVALIALLTSCQKELHFETDNSDRPFRIVSTIAVTGNDTLITTYSYDQQLRLASEVTTGKIAGNAYHNSLTFTRDAQGRIITVVHQLPEGNETVSLEIHYPDAAVMEYDYAISTLQSSSGTVRDSIAFSYNNGNMVKNERFRYTAGTGYLLAGREAFTFNTTGNVESTDIYSTVGNVNGHVVLFATAQYSYAGYSDYIWTTDNAAQNYLIVGLPNKNHESISERIIRDQTGLSPIDYIESTTLVLDETGRMPQTGEIYLFPQNTNTSLAFYYQFF